MLGCVAVGACAGVPLSVAAPEVELVNLTILDETAGKQRFALTFLISNSNAEPIPVEQIRYSVRLAGQGYLNGSSPTSVTLAAGAGRPCGSTSKPMPSCRCRDCCLSYKGPMTLSTTSLRETSCSAATRRGSSHSPRAALCRSP
jgi:hypothetical protein